MPMKRYKREQIVTRVAHPFDTFSIDLLSPLNSAIPARHRRSIGFCISRPLPFRVAYPRRLGGSGVRLLFLSMAHKLIRHYGRKHLHFIMVMNPLKRKLVDHRRDWVWNSFPFYSDLKSGLIRVDPIN
jgi:hypothetical protein